MATYIAFPTQVEDLPVCNLKGGKPTDWQFLPEEASRKEDGQKVTFNPRLEFLESLGHGDVVYFPLGGTGDGLKVRALQQGAEVFCLPFSEINRHKAGANGSLPPNFAQQGEKAQERILGMIGMANLIGTNPDLFRTYTAVDQNFSLLRYTTAQFLAVQEEIRKPFIQRTDSLNRQQSFVLQPKKGDDFVYDLIDSSEPEKALLQYEHDLELAMMRQLRRIPVFTEVLAPVRGIGPRLAARIITPIVDITRFPKLGGLTQFGGWSTAEVTVFKCQQCEKVFPKWSESCTNCGKNDSLIEGDPYRVARRFIRGKPAQFNPVLRMGLWLFGEQLVRSNSQFKWWYDGYKRQHAEDVGKVLYITATGKEAKLTPIWLERMARRKAVSKFVKYLWFGWWELHGRTFESHGMPFKASDLLHPEDHYPENFFDPKG